MTLQLGDIAPDFSAASTHGRIIFHEWAREDWVVLLSHPRDFTPVCTTELGTLARLKPDFDRRGVKLLGLSVDSVDSHRRWAEDILETQGQPLNFPLIADLDRTVARLYGMLHPQHDELYTVRTVFVIDPKKRIRLTLTYPQTTGRNFDEILRVVDALQLADTHAVVTPANWRNGDDVLIAPALNDGEAAQRFPNGWRAGKAYLRIAADPRAAGVRSLVKNLQALLAKYSPSELQVKRNRARF